MPYDKATQPNTTGVAFSSSAVPARRTRRGFAFSDTDVAWVNVFGRGFTVGRRTRKLILVAMGEVRFWGRRGGGFGARLEGGMRDLD